MNNQSIAAQFVDFFEKYNLTFPHIEFTSMINLQKNCKITFYNRVITGIGNSSEEALTKALVNLSNWLSNNYNFLCIISERN